MSLYHETSRSAFHALNLWNITSISTKTNNIPNATVINSPEKIFNGSGSIGDSSFTGIAADKPTSTQNALGAFEVACQLIVVQG
jgi:hypothetical protein